MSGISATVYVVPVRGRQHAVVCQTRMASKNGFGLRSTAQNMAVCVLRIRMRSYRMRAYCTCEVQGPELAPGTGATHWQSV